MRRNGPFVPFFYIIMNVKIPSLSNAGRSAEARDDKSCLSPSSLLKEITSLKFRLKELEGDSKRDSISPMAKDASFLSDARESELVNTLRKELTKVETEKATQEMDFMNQVSSITTENQKMVDSLREKLEQTERSNTELRERFG